MSSQAQNWSLFIVAVLVAAIGISTLADWIEEKLTSINAATPIVEEMQIVDSYRENDMLFLHIVGKKTKYGFECGGPKAKEAYYGEQASSMLDRKSVV